MACGSFVASYKFSAKEKDEETGYSYFGARYYMSDISIWNSVDPMADKYPNQSPFSYCGWRPINVIDPDGMDEWEVNKRGDVTWKNDNGGDKTHTLFALNGKGNRTSESTTVKDRGVLDQLTKTNGKGISKAITDKNGQNDMIKTFKFLADNTNVEWRLDRYSENNKSNYSLGTMHDGEFSPSSEDMGHSVASTIAFIHSHPNTASTLDAEKSSMGYWPDRNQIAGDSELKYSHYKKTSYYTYFPKSTRVWSVNGMKEPSFIRKTNSNYKKLFFGSLNTK